MSIRRPREVDDHWGDLTAEPRGVDYIEAEAGGVPVMWAIPKAAIPKAAVPKAGAWDRVILCLHGGGFVGGSLYTHGSSSGTSPRRPAPAR